jgi:uncharacterized membrane protein
VLPLVRPAVDLHPASAAAAEKCRLAKWTVPALLIIGSIPRLALAYGTFLNPDEALHYLLSAQPSLRLAYEASLSTAHPPLLILLLYYWRALGHSEFVLRLPSVLAGIGFAWMTYQWLKRVVSRDTALTTLILVLFAPSLILLSAEVRQYALLLFFAATCLYFLERAFEQDSPRILLLSFVALSLALLTHYSSLIFALCAGIYAGLRFLRRPLRPKLLAVWLAGQLCALGLVGFLYKTHISILRASGMPELITDTYLRSSIFHPGQDHVLSFVAHAVIRFFHYLFAQGAVGVLGLFFFLAGEWLLLVKRQGLLPQLKSNSARIFGLLLLLPLVLTCGLALIGAYPFGGTRHDSILAAFAMSGVALALTHAQRHVAGKWLKPVLVVVLALCNFFPNPTGAYIRPDNQRTALMRDALRFVRDSIPENSIIVTDNGGGLILARYLCSDITYDPWVTTPVTLHCADRRIALPEPLSQERLVASSEPPNAALYGLRPGTKVWVFEAGWITAGRKHDAAQEIRRLNCAAPRQFGKNIFICKTVLGG